eukprot:SAG11_NODE_26681_length_342_cov_0.831276_1_plen_74_part_10
MTVLICPKCKDLVTRTALFLEPLMDLISGSNESHAVYTSHDSLLDQFAVDSIDRKLCHVTDASIFGLQKNKKTS